MLYSESRLEYPYPCGESLLRVAQQPRHQSGQTCPEPSLCLQTTRSGGVRNRGQIRFLQRWPETLHPQSWRGTRESPETHRALTVLQRSGKDPWLALTVVAALTARVQR